MQIENVLKERFWQSSEVHKVKASLVETSLSEFHFFDQLLRSFLAEISWIIEKNEKSFPQFKKKATSQLVF